MCVLLMVLFYPYFLSQKIFGGVSLLDCHFAQQVSFLLGFGVLICLKWCMRRFNLYVIRLCKLLNDSSCLYTSTTE